ncbi:HAD family hydrolase [Hyphococcus luteus]|uniref:HAD-IB family hydrolase n=1 Tax=Hyphococcus luteus TaxID=2058213 RepID=A0A2S7K3J2_9PROT|nr:HAD-IB family hydrolase [Marinicaulis flavus]PQA87072.1 HAD-IB family hydrolase [Marinicaulis flavus]
MAPPPDRTGLRNAAIFDLDRTITRRGTFTPFLLSVRAQGPARFALFARFLPHMALYKTGRLSRTTLKNRMLAMALGGFEREEIAAHADRFVAQIMTDGLHADALAAIARHRAAGDMLILATASVDFYARLFAERLGFDHCIASPTDFDAARDAPPQITGENCYGLAKRAMVDAQLEALCGADRAKLNIAFYTDHISDLPLLESADAPYVVNPKPALRAHAQKADWPICSWIAQGGKA